jgi:DNA polymerase V
MYEIKNISSKRGGKRSGAGRKSLYGSPTKAIRVPEHMVDEVRDFIQSEDSEEYSLPMFASKVSAGFPSPMILWTPNLI